jgi:hypothetical protein
MVKGTGVRTVNSLFGMLIAETVKALPVTFLIVKLSTRMAVANVSAMDRVVSVPPVRGEVRTIPDMPLPLRATLRSPPDAEWVMKTVSVYDPTLLGANVTRILMLSAMIPVEPVAVNREEPVVIPVMA